ncbi:MAG: prepilin-type N-terminal cleavage/methylation domain-containing protein [Planctomycetota bacterium]
MTALHAGIASKPVGRGFTLVELAVVIAVLAVVAAVAVPRFASASARSRLDAAAARVTNDIALLSATAQAASTDRQAVFDSFSDQYVLLGVRDRGRMLNRGVNLGTAPFETNLVSATFDGSPLLTMNGYGVAETSGTINLAVGSFGKRIVLLAGSSSVQVRTMELNSPATGDVMPSVRRVSSDVTIDAAVPPATARTLD